MGGQPLRRFALCLRLKIQCCASAVEYMLRHFVGGREPMVLVFGDSDSSECAP